MHNKNKDDVVSFLKKLNSFTFLLYKYHLFYEMMALEIGLLLFQAKQNVDNPVSPSVPFFKVILWWCVESLVLMAPDQFHCSKGQGQEAEAPKAPQAPH